MNRTAQSRVGVEFALDRAWPGTGPSSTVPGRPLTLPVLALAPLTALILTVQPRATLLLTLGIGVTLGTLQAVLNQQLEPVLLACAVVEERPGQRRMFFHQSHSV